MSAGVHPSSPGLWRGAGRCSWHRQLLGISELPGSGIRQLRRHHAFLGHGWVFCHVVTPVLVMGGSSVMSSCLSWSWVGLLSCRHAFSGHGWVFCHVFLSVLAIGGSSCLPGHGWVFCQVTMPFLVMGDGSFCHVAVPVLVMGGSFCHVTMPFLVMGGSLYCCIV